MNINKEKIKQYLPFILVGLVGGGALFIGRKSSSNGVEAGSNDIANDTDNYGVVDNQNYTNLANNVNTALQSQNESLTKKIDESNKSFLEQISKLTNANSVLQGQLDSKTEQTNNLINNLSGQLAGDKQTISQLTSQLHDVTNALTALQSQKSLVVTPPSNNYYTPPPPSTIVTGTTGNSSDGKLGSGSGSKLPIPSSTPKEESVVVPTTKLPDKFFIKYDM